MTHIPDDSGIEDGDLGTETVSHKVSDYDDLSTKSIIEYTLSLLKTETLAQCRSGSCFEKKNAYMGGMAVTMEQY
ncbi:hypothetical protein BHYA_0291g00170 [Botrytis hyacinthi]|uniref:Uncharacterized protein n=1 Tax=Botrytis hyacinthi TaxID=278943 RepID=A0A4Z1GEF7_9HELO|nr:hypothetical protein BHYA_0291g00170 [Botrytis hyacinthi]